MWQQIDPDGRRQDSTKGKAALIPLSPQARVLLAELKLKSGLRLTGADDPIFKNGSDCHRHPRDVQRAFAKARAGLSVEPRALRFHDLRHSSISALANRDGANLVQIQAFARHANMLTTLGYVHKVEAPEWSSEMGAAFAEFGGAS